MDVFNPIFQSQLIEKRNKGKNITFLKTNIKGWQMFLKIKFLDLYL